MQKFRASNSVISKWASGVPSQQDEAIMMYFKIPMAKVDYLEKGKELHAEWEGETLQSKAEPAVFGAKVLADNFFTELKIVHEVDEWLDLVGVIDLLTYNDSISGYETIDYKSGDGGKGNFQVKTASGDLIDTMIPAPHFTSGSYLSKHQLGIYSVLGDKFLSEKGIDSRIKRVCIKHYNQATGQVDVSYKWVDREMKVAAIEWVITHASDMHNFLLSRDVYSDPYAYLGIKP